MTQSGRFAPDLLPNTHVYIICPSGQDVRELRVTIARESHVRWEEQDRIHLFAESPRFVTNSDHITNRINRFADKIDGHLNVVTLSPIQFLQDKLSERIGIRRTFGSVRAFNEGIPRILRDLGLDTASITCTQLAKWELGEITRVHLMEWISQFQRAGSNRWIAERLLAVLDFWSGPRLLRAMRIDNESLSGFTKVCVNNKLGRSASKLANLLRNRLAAIDSSVLLSDLKEAVENDQPARILFVEDCLLSGNEISRVLGGLLGIEDVYGNRRTDPLNDPMLLSAVDLSLRFGVVTNGGLQALQSFLDSHDLQNVRLDTVGSDRIDTLTPSGIRSLKGGTLFDGDDCVVNPGRNLVRPAFKDDYVWGSHERRAKAIRFCDEVGRQLFREYVSRAGKSWTERRIEESGLGVRGLALALAFSHTVPKSTLPLFWGRGRVTFNKAVIDWIPLFPGKV